MKHAARHVDWHAVLTAALAVIAAIGWLHTVAADLSRGDIDRGVEIAQLHKDVRELRAQVADCGRTR